MADAVDILLDASGDLPAFTRHGSGTDVVLQRLGRRLRTFLGEWVLDQRVGLDIIGWTQQKPPDVGAIGAAVRREVEGTPGVARVASWEGAFDRTARRVTFTARVVLDNGTVVSGTVTTAGPGSPNGTPVILLLPGLIDRG